MFFGHERRCYVGEARVDADESVERSKLFGQLVKFQATNEIIDAFRVRQVSQQTVRRLEIFWPAKESDARVGLAKYELEQATRVRPAFLLVSKLLVLGAADEHANRSCFCAGSAIVYQNRPRSQLHDAREPSQAIRVGVELVYLFSF